MEKDVKKLQRALGFAPKENAVDIYIKRYAQAGGYK